MDFTLSLSSDWFNLINIPLILITLKEVIPKWKTIWDNNLTFEDRRLILRIVIFLALPIVVLIHELGHLFAAYSVGAHVVEFHYGPVAGHVTVDGNIPPEQMLWIAFAGNLAQIVVGLISLILATVVSSAALVVFLVYLGLYAIGDTVIFYALLSFASDFGDWKHMYDNPCTNLVHGIEAFQAVLVALILFCIYAPWPRLWFTRKTMPEWQETLKTLTQTAEAEPSVDNYVALSGVYVTAGLYKEAGNCLDKAALIDPTSPILKYNRAELELNKDNVSKAITIYEELVADEQLTSDFRAEILLQVGDLFLFQRATDKALTYYERACQLDPTQGDARLQKIIIKANRKDYKGLEADIAKLQTPDIHWIYPRNEKSAQHEIAKLEISLKMFGAI